MTIIQTQDLTKTYQENHHKVHALNDVNLEIKKGEFIAVAGPSGSGKTTFLNLIGGLDRPTKGKVLLDGTDIYSLSKHAISKIRLNKIGFVFQSYNLIPVLTAYENAEMILLLQGVNPVDRKKKVYDVLEKVDLNGLENRKPKQLSGGQQQRVAVARAIASNPSIVLADEPTANLDSRTAINLIQLMKKLNSDLNITFLFATHDPMVMEMAKRLVTLKDGRVGNDIKN